MKDSLNFLPMSLAALPKAFGFEKDAMKGYFPSSSILQPMNTMKDRYLITTTMELPT